MTKTTVATATTLTNSDTGRWAVTTRTSSYLLDLDARTVTRVPASTPVDGPWVVEALTGDHQAHPLVELAELRLDASMVFFADIHDHGAPSIVVTTHVQSITTVA